MKFNFFCWSILINFFFYNSQNAYSFSPADSVVKVKASKQYKAGFIKRLFFGAHYRKEWNTAVRMPVFDITKEKGGLTPVKQGGSRQTTNLRLVNSLGHQYVIRSVNKALGKALPKELRETAIADILQDQASSAHPYGALVIPPLANAAGILYVNPKLIYIPRDTAFGEFTDVFADMIAFIEERPDDDMSHEQGSANSEKVVGAEKMYEHLRKDHDNKIDEVLFAKTRLFDMMIGDWGRHEDQWRWATFKSDGARLFQPVPRDRDHVFYKSDGILPWLSSRKWAVRNNQNFGKHYHDVVGLNLSAASQDRSLLTRVTKDEWINAARELQTSLTDAAIENAVLQLPRSIHCTERR